MTMKERATMLQQIVDHVAEIAKLQETLHTEHRQRGICTIDRLQLTDDALPLFRAWCKEYGHEPETTYGTRYNRVDADTTIGVQTQGIHVFVYMFGRRDIFGDEVTTCTDA